MGNQTQNSPSFNQKYSPQLRSKHYYPFQIYKNLQNQMILLKQIQQSQSVNNHSIYNKLQTRAYMKYIYPIKYYYESSNNLCNNNQRLILICKQPFKTLQMIMQQRRNKGMMFSYEEIDLIINNVCLGLKNMKDNNQRIYFLQECKIFIDDDVYLVDPLMIQTQRFGVNMNKYLSPQQLNYNNHANMYQSSILMRRIYSLGLICLQILYPHAKINQSYLTSINNKQQIDFNFIANKILQLKDFSLQQKLSIMLNIDPIKRLDIYSIIEKEKINYNNIRFLRNNQSFNYSYSNVSLSSQKTTDIMKNNNQMAKIMEKRDNIGQRKSLQHKNNTWMNKDQQRESINLGFNNDKISMQRKSLPAKNHYENRSMNNINLNTNTPLSSLNNLMNHNNNEQSKLKKQTIVKFVNKTPQYKIKINQVIRSKNDNKQNIIINYQTKTNSSPNLLSKPHKQFKYHLNSQNTPIKQKKKHYFSTIKQVTQNDDNNSSQRLKQSFDMALSGRFQGSIVSGMKNGRGIFYFNQGCVYDGEWKDNKMNGYGKLLYPNGKIAYQGEWSNNQFHGYGKVYNDNPKQLYNGFFYKDFNRLEEEWIRYQGDLVYDRKQGYGKFYLSNNQNYQGSFINDKIEGQGTFYTINGEAIRGLWKDNILQRIIA